MRHATAIIHPKAHVDPTVSVGPYAVIDEGVVLGPHCVVGPHVYLTGQTTVGAHNRFHAGCVIGNVPQDLKYRGAPSRLRIGDHNTFRECVTVNCSTDLDEDTTLGSHNLLMACSHVAHNCHLGNRVILANGALLGGHVTVEDRVVISGNCLVHQFTRLGTLAMMQGGAAISKDLPPYTMARGVNRICGLNSVGLRRAGLSSDERLDLRRLYHRLFRSGLPLRRALEAARREHTSPVAHVLLEFLAAAKRGVCTDRSKGAPVDEAD
ncbi:MAG: acyl-ACP--UDP-N-acetylglucosamine O-acyltransferase [Verrucomicrobia bacterium]|jgi:UDP-N-acetylglucosamine acyltransferase|nr:acyl-ACP--UDP-N-acetylglucosamine O-acyltransferase [Verrucomicrobiota bacterium]OQC66431.1 MAG: Acyl-(acyl-carrier-protein)--UDP-N-acetylglucosamine O-acyltransferase [Verrucomicrobia bacterium ADurb.Bin006]MDI9381375.1 acyl-ACP--UDP-N-acetylglucosamine O-acyltransferase [Verrucomicrobiota bacterium]NMD18973.1 acyl-ACP--UDP-N-acetylglucosamine O-acyltransferase [Verrucomicrobiota bacterium]HOA62407.1 acyl-ACP--UDP-N-acetylglucosamine O-acyltransferase [Verrucomicrobiota bacterium]